MVFPPKEHVFSELHSQLFVTYQVFSEPLLKNLRKKAATDELYQSIIPSIKEGKLPWETPMGDPSRPFREVWDRLSIENGKIVLDGSKLVIPLNFRRKILEYIHTPHAGIVKSLALCKSFYYWPNMKKELSDMIGYCEICNKLKASLPPEPYKQTRLKGFSP